jgi:hypothetical protein
MRVWSVLALVCVLLAASAASAQEKKYTVEDLRALVQAGSWDEASQHLEDIPPAKRDAAWKQIVEKVAIGQLKALDLDRDPLAALGMADAYTKRFAFLVKHKPFMQVRADVGYKGFEHCFAQGAAEICNERLLPFVEADKGNVDLAIKAAQLQMRNRDHAFVAMVWRLAAEWSKGSKKACKAERFTESILAALGRPTDHVTVQPALKAAEVCLPHIKAELQKSAQEFGDTYTKKNVCPLLKKKNAVGKARCN